MYNDGPRNVINGVAVWVRFQECRELILEARTHTASVTPAPPAARAHLNSTIYTQNIYFFILRIFIVNIFVISEGMFFAIKCRFNLNVWFVISFIFLY